MRASVVLALLIAPLAARAQSYKPGFNIFSPQQDYEIGRQSALAANRQLRTSTDVRVTRIGKKLIARAGREVPLRVSRRRGVLDQRLRSAGRVHLHQPGRATGRAQRG
jgi:hypothetical protein